jgi:hypothetical protein
MGSHAPAKRITRRFDRDQGLDIVVEQLVAPNLARLRSPVPYDSMPM